MGAVRKKRPRTFELVMRGNLIRSSDQDSKILWAVMDRTGHMIVNLWKVPRQNHNVLVYGFKK